MTRISVVVPVMNEEKNIAPLIRRCEEVLREITHEIIIVDDGSSDSTRNEVKAHATANVKLVVLRKNYGQSTALAAGIDEAQGDYIVTIDGDLQNDPSDIPGMLRKIESEPVDMVVGIREKRKDNWLWRKIPSKIANYIIRKMTSSDIQDHGCTLKIIDKDIAKSLGIYGELHRFIPELATEAGARVAQVKVKHHSRHSGETKYGLGRTFKVVSDLMLILFLQRYLQKPMHFFGLIGFMGFMAGVLINFYLLFLKFMGEDIWGKPLLFLGGLLVLGGIQFITLGLILEVIMRTYYESQSKKVYQIREVFRGESATKKV